MANKIGRLLLCVAHGFALLLTGIVLAAFVPVVHLAPQASLWGGLAFAPSILLTGPLILFSLLCWLLGGRARVSLAYGMAAVLHLLYFGDYTLWQKALSSQTSAHENGVKVAALNLRYYSFGIERILDGLRQNDIDVALLSENDIEPHEFDDLQSRLRNEKIFMTRQGETAIYSRLPVKALREVELPSRQASLWDSNDVAEQGENAHRSFLHAVLDLNGTPLHVISIRLIAGRSPGSSLKANISWGKYLLATQQAESQFFANYVSKIQDPLIFGGDLNATPSSFPVRTVAAVADDAWLSLHPFGVNTFSTIGPTLLRLDYLFCRGGAVPLAVELTDQYISDHFVVTGRFAVKSTRTSSGGL